MEQTYGAPNYAPLEVVLERGEGVYVWDVDGNRYVDCISAYSAVNQGHVHPAIRDALVRQAGRLTLTSRAVYNDRLPLLLAELTQYAGYEMALLMNTGAEAVETAIKLARRYGYRRKGIAPDRAEIVVCSDNFHGRTTTIVGASTEAQYRREFGPFPAGFRVVPFGDVSSLEAAIGATTCALLIEPIQGEGGVNVPPPGYFAAAARVCRERGALLMSDEVQTGFGRTGSRFGADAEGVRPDVTIVGKALGGGFYPVSGILAPRDLLELFGPGDHGSTFGGNPLGCEVARAALRVIVDEDLAGNARRRGNEMVEGLRALRSPLVRQVRGRGLLIGVELTVKAKTLAKALLREGVLAKDTRDYVLRIAPPLVIDPEQVAAVVDAVGRALRHVEAPATAGAFSA